jgi:N-glycosylase/DNA lyase
VHLLRDPAMYIRFHNTKHKRLHMAREHWPSIEAILRDRGLSARERRDRLQEKVNGFGMKEASHYLRNIGHRGLAIIDRHLLTNLVACGVYDEPPAVNSIDRYREVEAAFESFCERIGIDMDEIDLLFWCAQTGHILK